MNTCCRHAKKKKQSCPSCKQSCLPVAKQTVLHQLQRPYDYPVLVDDFYHCANSDCSLCYFSITMMIMDDKIRQQSANSMAMLCYCFDVSRDVYRDALRSGKAEIIKHFVIQQTKDHLCACDVRNPSGHCCLADFKRMEALYDC